MRIGVALGSNLGDRLENLRMARNAIEQLEGVGSPFLASAIYATAPVDCEAGAGEFLNAVMELEYGGDPSELLVQLKKLERGQGRSQPAARNVSRPIDLDLLYAGSIEIRQEGLQLPHPRMRSRRFVLEPLADIRPELILPGEQKSVRELLALLDESAKVVRLTNDWASR